MSKRQWYKIRNAAPADDGTPEVLIYDEIDSYFGVSAADLVRELAEIDAPEILVRINSPGGDIFDGIAILNALRGHDARVTVQVDGLAASAASVVAMGGDEIVMNANSQMMLHNAWTVCVGDAADMQNKADMLERQNANIASVYASRAGGADDDWRAVMADETWLSAQEAVDAGLADRVIEAEPEDASTAARVAASFDRSRFRYADRQAAPAPKIAARAQTPQPKVEAEVTNGKEPIVATLTESALQKLGLDAEADEDAIEAAIDEKIAAAQKEPEPPAEPTAEQVTAAAAKLGLTVANATTQIAIDKTLHDKLIADAAAGAEARAQQVREADERTIADALTGGKITSASAQTWREQLGKSRETTLALLGAMPENRAMATAELGYGAANEDTSVDPEMETMLAKITGQPIGKA